MPRFTQVSEGHVTAATEVLLNLREDVYSPLKPVVLCPVCSGLAALLNMLKKHRLLDPEEIIDARDAAGTCLVLSELIKQLLDVMATVEELITRDKRMKLSEVDLCIGSIHILATSAQNKMECLVGSLSPFYTDKSTLKSNWDMFCVWMCGVLVSLYCIQKPKIWNKLSKSSDLSFNIKSFMMSPEKGYKSHDKSVSFTAEDDNSHSLALKLVSSTLMEEMVGFSTHLKKVQQQLTNVSRVIRDSGLSRFPNPVPY